MGVDSNRLFRLPICITNWYPESGVFLNVSIPDPCSLSYFCVKGKGHIYLKSVNKSIFLPVTKVPTLCFDLGCSYLTQWLCMDVDNNMLFKSPIGQCQIYFKLVYDL